MKTVLGPFGEPMVIPTCPESPDDLLPDRPFRETDQDCDLVLLHGRKKPTVSDNLGGY